MSEFLKGYNRDDLTFEKVWLLFQKVGEQLDKTSEEFDKSNQKFNEKLDRISERLDETGKNLKETGKSLKETGKSLKETEKIVKSLSESTKRLDNFVNNIGQTVEQFFIEAIKQKIDKEKTISINGYVFDDALFNITIGKKKKKKEVDIVLINDTEKILAIIEVKTKLHRKNFEDIIKIKEYLECDRTFSDYKYILGLASFNINSECEELAKEYKVFLVKPNIEKNAIQADFLGVEIPLR